MASRSRNSFFNAQKGFTLLEVMVALVIFALIATVIQKLTAQSIDQYRWLELKSMSAWIAENKLAELRIAGKSSPPKTYKEEVEFGRESWRLNYTVSKTSEQTLYKVVINVELLQPPEEPLQTLSYEGYFNAL